jgi:hypothetical protein
MVSERANTRPRYRDAVMKTKITLLILLIVFPIASRAADKLGEGPLNKLTFSYYGFSSGKDGVDLNLRHTVQVQHGVARRIPLEQWV